MIIDSRTIPEHTVIESDLCVVGAGAAGLTLVGEFLHRHVRVCLLECGGLTPDSATQAQFAGETDGTSYFNLAEARQASFGGTTSIWAGWCRPLDSIDLEARSWVPNSGWPFERAHLDQYYRRAAAVCQLDHLSHATPLLTLDPELIQTQSFQLSPPTHFGRAYHRAIQRAAHIQTLLHAHAVDIETAAGTNRVSTIRVATLEGTTFRVAARVFVLSAGGIENPRILLLSAAAGQLRSVSGPVGRYFMDHPYVNAGWHVYTRKGLRACRTQMSKTESSATVVKGVFTMPDQVLRTEGLTNVAIFYRAPHQNHPLFGSASLRSLGTLIDTLRGRMASPIIKQHILTVLANLHQVAAAGVRRIVPLMYPPNRLALRAFGEPVPNPENRVSLIESRDDLGRRRVRLEWRLGQLELRSLARAHALLDRALRRANLGQLEEPITEESGWVPSLSGGRHHMGTTRMHQDPRMGVVDANCKVHEMQNLFIAGSSVFPTAGYANPMLTIVALSLRLADHLTRVLGAKETSGS